jgi:hypothetical protein
VGNSGGPKKVSYKLTARELKSPLPAVKADVAVQGDATITREIDENNRRTSTYDFDLLVSGDAIALAGQLRQAIITGVVRLGMPVAGDVPTPTPAPTRPRPATPTRRRAPTSPTATPTRPARWRAARCPRSSSAAARRGPAAVAAAAAVSDGGDGLTVPRVILRERLQLTQVTENRLRANFVVLDSADNNFLMNFNASIETQTGQQTIEEKRYPGAEPVLVLGPQVDAARRPGGHGYVRAALPRPARAALPLLRRAAADPLRPGEQGRVPHLLALHDVPDRRQDGRPSRPDLAAAPPTSRPRS